MTVVYLDTSIWLSFGFTRDRNHGKALAVISQLRSRAIVIFVSRHIVSEVLDVLKERAKLHPSVRAASYSPNVHRALVEKWFKQFTTTVLGVPNVRIRDTTTSMVKILTDQQKIMLDAWGTISTWIQCPICHSAFNFVQYDCPGKNDVLHSIIADEIQCDILLSFDKDFAIMGRLPRFAHMPIQVV